MQNQMNHQVWLDSLNYHQSQGYTLAEAVAMVDLWPFPSVNGQQTAHSKALQSDKGQHRPTPINLTDIKDAPW